jgi:cytochrome c-type biogenesis protein CcmH
MTAFVVAALVLVAIALAFVLTPLLRAGRRGKAGSSRGRPGVSRDALNAAVHRDQLRELEADLESGSIGRERYDEARAEIERRALEDSGEGAAASSSPTGRGSARAAIAIAVAVPALTLAMYLQIGEPDGLDPAAVSGDVGHAVDGAQIVAMVDRLAARLAGNPDDAPGWAMLGRSLAVLGRFAEAGDAYAKALARGGDDPQLLADYADMLGVARGRRLTGEPESLIARALAIDPDHPKALALAGTAAFDRQDYDGAVLAWDRLVRVAPADSELAKAMRPSLAEARALAARSGGNRVAERAIGGAVAERTAGGAAAERTTGSAAAEPIARSAGAITGIVQLPVEHSLRVAPTDTLFVYARAAEGSRMPLAIVRAQVKDLPFRFTLDESSAMIAGATLADHRKLVVGARIARGGGAAAQPGDLHGQSAVVAPGARDLLIVLSDVVQ